MNNISIKGNLTPGFISNKLSPFLDSLASIQNVISEIKREHPTPIRIHEISWEESRDEGEFWAVKHAISLEQAKQALSGLGEAIEQPHSITLRRARAQAINTYMELISKTILRDLSETETSIINYQYSPIVRKGMHIWFDALICSTLWKTKNRN